MSVGHTVCGSPFVSLWVPGLDQCLWVTLCVCVCHPLFLFRSLGLISVCGSPCVWVTICSSLCPLASSVSVGYPVCGSPVVSLCGPWLDQCLWVTLCVGHPLFLFMSLGLISVCGSPCVWVTLCFSLCPLALSVSVGHPVKWELQFCQVRKILRNKIL